MSITGAREREKEREKESPGGKRERKI